MKGWITHELYGDSFIGFSTNILVWAFALAALYKATKSVLTCAVYHAFIDAIGAVYDWNALFDPFPGGIAVNLYRILVLTCSVLLWLYAERRDRLKGPGRQMRNVKIILDGALLLIAGLAVVLIVSNQPGFTGERIKNPDAYLLDIQK